MSEPDPYAPPSAPLISTRKRSVFIVLIFGMAFWAIGLVTGVEISILFGQSRFPEVRQAVRSVLDRLLP